jgi:hypothetical protein
MLSFGRSLTIVVDIMTFCYDLAGTNQHRLDGRQPSQLK